MDASERRFTEYLTASGYAWKFEPDYATELNLPAPPPTTPDFLITRDETRVICEVRHFRTTHIRDRLAASGGYAALSDKEVYASLRYAMIEKANQLAPFAGLDLPLVLVLSNPLGADVQLDSHHITVAMFGNPKWAIPIDRRAGGAMGPGEYRLEDYGAFRSIRGSNGTEIINPHPHVSAVATLHQRERAQDWREEIFSRHPSKDSSMEAAYEAAFDGLTEINREVAAGNEPEGAYQWLEIYELDGDQASPLPPDWFAGARDTRYGFHADNSYGPIVSRAES